MSLAQRAGSVTQVAQDTTNIYQQQYQMGLFLQSYYRGAAVAANDVGAINYLADIKCLDLVGLASLEIAKLKLADQLSQETIDALAKSRGVTVAILYDFWFQDENRSLIPAHWRLVGQWTIPNNVSAGGETVSFYATDPSTEDYLRDSLRAFAGRLPPQVRQTGRYVELSSPVAGSVDRGDPAQRIFGESRRR